VGFTTSRKVGNAVTRNRARRRLREAARKLLPEYGLAGVDYVIVARQAAPDAPWGALLDDLQNALIRLRADLERGADSSPRAPRPRRPKRSTESQ
jgi:ribonuclease P protein component